jgi:hypothetical protein
MCRRAVKITRVLKWTIFTLVMGLLVLRPLWIEAHEPHRLGENGLSQVCFTPGERLIYRLKWSFIPAGEAVLEVMPMALIRDVPAYHFRMTVTSNSFVDMFFKVRDCIEGYVDQQISRSVRYVKKQQEGRTHRQVTVDFNWHTGKVRYKDEEKLAVNELTSATFDPLSILYFVRTLSFTENDILERKVTDGITSIEAKARVLSRSTIKVDGRRFDTYLLEPEMEHIGGVFEKEKSAKIKLWVTADARHIPIKVASKIAIGTFVGELISDGEPESSLMRVGD